MILFETIDGNYTLPENAKGYCLYYDGVLTQKLIDTHKCTWKFGSGNPCRRLCKFGIKYRGNNGKKDSRTD